MRITFKLKPLWSFTLCLNFYVFDIQNKNLTPLTTGYILTVCELAINLEVVNLSLVRDKFVNICVAT